jgi:hypothetical protein
MNRVFFVVMVGTLGAYTAAAQGSASAQAGASAQSQTSAQTTMSGTQASTSDSASAAGSAKAGKNSADVSSAGMLSSGTKIDSTLTKPLDAKKCKPGDVVEARAAQDVKQDGKVVLKKGTPLMGHVTEAQARANGQSESRLGVVFDHAVMKDGRQIPLNASIQALASQQSSAMAGAGSDDVMASAGAMGTASGGARAGGGVLSGAASTVGATAGGVVNTAGSVPGSTAGNLGAMARSTGAVGGLTSSGRLASNSSGVFGLEGLSIASAASGAAQSSAIVSATKNVHLDSGTQMLLSVAGDVH